MKILIAAGGTGGHIYPGLAIAEKIKSRNSEAEIIFIGSHVGMEKNIVPQAGYPIEYLRARGFEKGFSFETIAAVKGIFDALSDARRVLKKYQPDLVIGTGGFTAAALLYVATQKRIPTLIHEQNAYPGRANRMLGKKVDRVAISFKEAQAYFPVGKTVLCGNPVRPEYIGSDRNSLRNNLGLNENSQMILIMGGSQGAASINLAALDLMEAVKTQNNVYIYHLTGKEQIEEIMQEVENRGLRQSKNLVIQAYHQKLYNLLGAADLVISRAGAMSVAEIAVVGVASILVPYPLAAGNHQEFNAKVLTECGAGILINDEKLSGAWLVENVKDLLEHPQKLAKMRIKTREKGIPDAGDRIYEELLKLMERS
ncbi:undecaprenyldiphospho-muramoylpentapeptide beta-N-acetylglucosaminyltransferase [Eubacteriaceae bacterium ES3]|nr:undecaprenyldiphospho-muramoylpentapeptide beta-N-acetylglucosaminyltransferase [Eubacteriaceae bacterium ES3]